MEKLIKTFAEVELKEKDDFLKVQETLTRIGIASDKNNKLWQSCHILHKRGHYYIVHFKELFMLDGRESNFNEVDLTRRNTIVNLLSEWGLIINCDSSKTLNDNNIVAHIKILPFAKKEEWKLIPKYSIGRYKG